MNTDNAAVIPLILDPSQMHAELRKAERELSASVQRMADEQVSRRGQQVFNQTHTAAEKYALAQQEINSLLSAGAISQDTHTRALQRLEQQYYKTAIAADKAGQSELRAAMMAQQELLTGSQAAAIGGGGGTRAGGTGKLGNIFGRGSEFTLLTKTLMGGGAIMGLGLLTNAMERASGAALRMAESIREGKKSAAEIHAEAVSSIPVLGSLADAGVNMAKAFGLVAVDEFGTGLRNLRAKIADITTGESKTGLAKINEDFDKLRVQLNVEFGKSIPSNANADISRQLNQLFAARKELEEKRAQAIAAQRAADEEKERKAREGTVLDLRGRIDALQVEADTYLMSAEALREYNLQRQLFSIADERERELIERATRASWEAKDAKDEEAEALERLTKAREESISAFERESEARQRAAERIREAGKTPLDRAREAIAEAQGLLRSGDIGLPDYQAFIARQREGLGGGGSWGGITSMSGALSALANAAATGRDRRAEEETARNTAEIKRLLDEAANKGKQLSEDGKAIIQAIKDRTLAGVIGVFR